MIAEAVRKNNKPLCYFLSVKGLSPFTERAVRHPLVSGPDCTRAAARVKHSFNSCLSPSKLRTLGSRSVLKKKFGYAVLPLSVGNVAIELSSPFVD